MTLEWTGRYHALVEEIIFMANGYSAIRSREIFETDPPCSPEQIQVLQYLLEHEDEQLIMKSIAGTLGMTKSSFTKLIARMEMHGLVEKIHLNGNHKNIVLRASADGRSVYQQYVENYGKRIFGSFFKSGEPLSDEVLQRFTEMVHMLNQQYRFPKSDEVTLLQS